MRQVLIYPAEPGIFAVLCPSLPGCISQGRTKGEAINNIKAAIQAHTEALQGKGLPVPDEDQSALLVTV